MRLLFIFLFPLYLLASHVNLPKEQLEKIGLLVWQNECNGTLDGLISWNPSENFPSLGIGHFIWYPEGVEEKKFEEGFPPFIEFLSKKLKDTEIKIPSWIKSKKGFPWKTREVFINDKRSKKMLQLRDLLAKTLDCQFEYLFKRFEAATTALEPELTPTQKKNLAALLSCSNGIYALVDYVNFKGTGLSPTERYRGQGWGLLQVLQNIPEEAEDIENEFITSAKKVLARRIKNAPVERNEAQYQKGWYKRLETYQKNI